MEKKQTITPTLKALKKVEGLLRNNFEIVDWVGVRILFAVAVAHYIPGEPLWLRIIGASRSGRTEILRPIMADEDSVEMETLTPAAIRGGFKGAEKLLDRINGKRVITKDLAALVTIRRETRLEIFGLLRGVKDGSLTSDFGTYEGHIHQQISFDWILAVTPVIESIRQIESLLGERYIDLHWIIGNREEMAYKAAENNPDLPKIREQLADSVCSLLKRAKSEAEKNQVTLSEKPKRVLARWANSVAICRSPVQKDSRGNILVIPKPEVGTSLAQDFCKVALGLRLLGFNKLTTYLSRLAWDCIPSIRAKMLKALKHNPMSVNRLHEVTGLPKSTIYYHLDNLQMLGAVMAGKAKTGSQGNIPTYDCSEDDDRVRQLAIKLPPFPKKVRFKS